MARHDAWMTVTNLPTVMSSVPGYIDDLMVCIYETNSSLQLLNYLPFLLRDIMRG